MLNQPTDAEAASVRHPPRQHRGRRSGSGPGRAERLGRLFAQHGLDPMGEFDVVLGHAAFAVGAEGKVQTWPVDRDIGVMVHLLGLVSDGIDGPDGLNEGREHDVSLERSVEPIPALQLIELTGDLICFEQSWHALTVAEDMAVKPTVVVGAALIDDQGRLLAARRSAPSALAGRWEFPGGKVEPGERDQDALQREIHEELGVDIEIGARIGGDWPLTDRLIMRLWIAQIVRGEPTPLEDHDDLRWLMPGQWGSVDWLPADLPIVAALAQHQEVTAPEPFNDEGPDRTERSRPS